MLVLNHQELLRRWAEERQAALHSRSGAGRDSRDLNDLDAALSAVMTLAERAGAYAVEVERLRNANGKLALENGKLQHASRILAEANAAHRDRESRFSLLSEAFGMLEELAERYVEQLSRRHLGEPPDAADRFMRARRVLIEAREKADAALADREGRGHG